MYTDNQKGKPSKPVTLNSLQDMKMQGDKIACLTAYDASFAAQLEAAGVDLVLVGDSLGMVIQGHETTVPVTMEDIIYHTRAVASTRQRAMLVADMPFMSYASPEQALVNAARLMQEGGAHMIKLEGGAIQVDTVRQLSARGIPVCAHIGLTPQTVHKLGGYRVQGRGADAAAIMTEDALALQEAGADLLLLECVHSDLATKISKVIDVPVIGIGAGPSCDGQILVLYDILGISTGRIPKFSQNFLEREENIQAAIVAYVQAVKAGSFPADKHCFE